MKTPPVLFINTSYNKLKKHFCYNHCDGEIWEQKQRAEFKEVDWKLVVTACPEIYLYLSNLTYPLRNIISYFFYLLLS